MRKLQPASLYAQVRQILDAQERRNLSRRFWRGTVVTVSGDYPGPLLVQVIRNGEATPDGKLYPCPPHVTPAVGDDVILINTDQGSAVVHHIVSGDGAGFVPYLPGLLLGETNPGPLPITKTFDSIHPGSTLLFQIHASGYLSTTANQVIHLSVTLDGTSIGPLDGVMNPINTHTTYPPLITQVPAVTDGPHTLVLARSSPADLTDDVNDRFAFLVWEIPIQP